MTYTFDYNGIQLYFTEDNDTTIVVSTIGPISREAHLQKLHTNMLYDSIRVTARLF